MPLCGLSRFFHDFNALGGYPTSMNSNPVANCTLIIRSQVEYSAATQTVVLRCLLEKTATGQRRGFTDVDALLTALRAELIELQSRIIPPDQQNLKKPAGSGSTRDAPGPAP
jgi:hypothetical protein